MNNSSYSEIKVVLNILHGISVTDSTIRSIYNDNLSTFIDSSIDEMVENPSLKGPAQRLICMFNHLFYVSFMYVTHAVDSVYVTCHGGRINNCTSTDVGVDDEAISNWRAKLQMKSDEILVAFAWTTDDEKRYIFNNIYMESYSYMSICPLNLQNHSRHKKLSYVQ